MRAWFTRDIGTAFSAMWPVQPPRVNAIDPAEWSPLQPPINVGRTPGSAASLHPNHGSFAAFVVLRPAVQAAHRSGSVVGTRESQHKPRHNECSQKRRKGRG